MNKRKLTIILAAIIMAAAVCVLAVIHDWNPDIEIATDPEIAKLRANANATFDGYAEKEANALRDKIINSKNTEDIYEITGTKYYISADGNDDNDGLSPEKPIKSLWRLREIYKVDGDAVLFKRGDVFRFGESFKLKSNIIYGSYGEGVKPRLYGSPENFAQNDTWEKVSGNVWKISFPYMEACGLVINHSEIIGVKKINEISELQENGDFLHDTENYILYLYCDKGKPNEVFEDIEIMPTTSVITAGTNNKNVVIDNLCIKYSSGFGISSTNTNSGFTVTNCEFGFLGGKWVDSETKKLRYGNAIEFWAGAQDVTIENNWFYQTYDSALSWQGRSGSIYRNISFSNNLFEYNNADIEFFDRDGAIIENFRIENNIMRFTSMGWGTRTNDGGVRGIEGCIRAVTGGGERVVNLESVYFTNNVIDCPARQTINWNLNPEQLKTIYASGTKLYIKESLRTLPPCLQGLQNEEGLEYDRRFAENYEDLKSGFEIFEKGAQIYWEK